ncbi:hypothetical protein RhiirA4_486405 [Rhizophagus irregularis]|uniref:RRM domain-containing protein n=1 Tax=Rhizophagus irregularis TaxID=588596 RepID=A0A2I1HRB2_9GLOM|nr:hypothetical protein RhiirA4_486405 [Rhizophagus irregularis]
MKWIKHSPDIPLMVPVLIVKDQETTKESFDEEKSLFVTDIPLFLNETQIRQAFSRYSEVVKCKLTTRNHYYNAHIQFANVSSITQFADIWAIICLAILAGIPKNIKEADLLEIAAQVNAKAINISLSYNSYKPKSYARHGYSPSQCSLRPARKTNDRLNKLYTRFNAGPKRGCSDSQQSQSFSGSRSHSHSDLRSHGRNFSEHSKNSNKSITSPSPARAPVRSLSNNVTNSQGTNQSSDQRITKPVSSSSSTSPSPKPSLPPDVLEEIKKQLKDIAQ